jgi:hypothetical protein
MDCLPRNISIDWLRFQVSSYSSSMLRQIQRTLDLPFERKLHQLRDVRDTNFLALNKVWHEVHEFQGSLIGTRYPDAGSEDMPYRHFVDLNGGTLSAVTFDKLIFLLGYCQSEEEFIANRIDIALDFNPGDPRLSARNWESFLEDNLLSGYRLVRRVSNCGRTRTNRPGATVYLGSRESERFVRIYDKVKEGKEYDRLEIEFKRSRALWIMQEISKSTVQEVPRLLNGVVCSQINFKTRSEDTCFFERYKFGPVEVPAPTLHLDIERSIAFMEKQCATFAMVEEYMGSERFDKFMRSLLAAGKFRMKPRHRTILDNARQMLGVVASSVLISLYLSSNALASGLSCPAPVPLTFQIQQKFPIDIVNPSPSEEAYFNNIGDGCFNINSGLNFEKLCLPGMIVNALRPFIIVSLGIKFIFGSQ